MELETTFVKSLKKHIYDILASLGIAVAPSIAKLNYERGDSMRCLKSFLIAVISVILGALPFAEGAIYTSNSTINFEWSAPSSGSIASYNVFTSPDGVNFTLAGTTANTSYTINTIVGNTYYMQVQAVSSTGLGGAMSDPSEPIVVVASKNTLHASYWRAVASTGYYAVATLKNRSSSTVQVTPAVIAMNGVSYVQPTTISIPAHQSAVIKMQDYVGVLGGQQSGILEVTHSGNAGDVIGDMMFYGPNGYSMSFDMRNGSATATTLHSTYWYSEAAKGYNSVVLMKNTSNSTVYATPTVIGNNGSTYTHPSPLEVPPHQTAVFNLKFYVGAIGGQTSGSLELTHTGNAGDLIADMQIAGPDGYSLTVALRDNSATSNTLHATYWRGIAGRNSLAMLKNTSNSTIYVTPTVIGWDGASYTEPTPIAILAHQAARINMSSYASILGQSNGVLELSHTGNPGDVIGDIMFDGADGYSMSFAMRDSTASSTTLHATYWASDAASGYNSVVLIKNTTNMPVDATPTIIGSNGSSYTLPVPMSIPPHRTVVLNLKYYTGTIGGQTNGSLEISHTGIPGDIVADIQIAGPYGFSNNAMVR